MLKFRKMHHGAGAAPLTAASDPRLTRIGAFLRRTRADELPHPSAFAAILTVRPGLTGPSQLAFADEHETLCTVDPVADYAARILPEKIALDSAYVATQTLRADLAIIARTLLKIFPRTA
jgi:lipopolysaccharide/colanic/teichoic acid biosynthesis glycosyltransferase